MVEIGGVGGFSRLSVNVLIGTLRKRSLEATRTWQAQTERSGVGREWDSGGFVVGKEGIGGFSRPFCRDLEPLPAIVARMLTSVVVERKRRRRERVLS